jgi:streptomycin 6-kinase
LPIEIPAEFLGYAVRGGDWRTWMESLPGLVHDLLDEWALAADGPATHGYCAVVVPVRTADGTAAVLKVGWPHWEAEHEHLALRHWSGNGAVRLLRADPRRSALLLERLHETDLTSIPVLDACEVVAGLYKRLHVPAPPQLYRLSEVSQRWSRELLALPADAPIPRRYVEQAAGLLQDFGTDPGTDGTLLHTDLHYYNVLAADREPWLVIDPKPLSGDPHHEVAPLLWNRWEEALASDDLRTALRARFHTVVDVAGLDEHRARDWVVARMVTNAMWTIHDGDAASPEGREWITECVTLAKAVQD